MPYIGKNPVGGGFHKLDALTASATATYALTLNSAAYYPESANQLLVSLNGVIQAPQDSFTVSGSNLVFDTALTTSDSIDFVVALGDVLAVQTVTDGAITTAKLGNGAVTKAKMGTTELDLATIKDSTGTNTAMTIDSTGRILTPARPAFYAYRNSNQTITIGSWDKIEFDATKFDVGSDYSTSNHRFVAPVDGIYNFTTVLNPDYSSGSGSRVFGRFTKNGTVYAQFSHEDAFYASDRQQTGGSVVIDLDANDYVEVEIQLEGGTTAVVNGQSTGIGTWFCGFLVG